MIRWLLLATAIFSLGSPASAQISEISLGANFHDIDWTGLGSGADKERSPALNGEVIFEEPEFLKWAFSPQPYIGGALNLGGETSYGGGGLLWRQNFFENFYLDFSLGLVIHNGTIEVKASPIVQSVIDDATIEAGFTEAQRAQFTTELAEFRNRQQTEIDFGSRILFREQIALGYRWSEKWSTHIFIEHLSHGNILVSDRPNEGLDTLGLRASYHF